MFDVGFTELFLLLVVGLVVLGPERLPKVARTLGLWVGRARAMYTNVRSDIERELELEELKRAREAIRQQLAEDATGPIKPPESDGGVEAAKGEPSAHRGRTAGGRGGPPSRMPVNTPHTQPK